MFFRQRPPQVFFLWTFPPPIGQPFVSIFEHHLTCVSAGLPDRSTDQTSRVSLSIFLLSWQENPLFPILAQAPPKDIVFNSCRVYNGISAAGLAFLSHFCTRFPETTIRNHIFFQIPLMILTPRFFMILIKISRIPFLFHCLLIFPQVCEGIPGGVPPCLPFELPHFSSSLLLVSIEPLFDA